jgi:hypothetical protein
VSAPTDETKLAAAKFVFLEAVSDDTALPKIASKLAIKLTTKYMHAETGGVAWASIRTLCADLSVAADSAIRKTLAAMVAGGHLVAEAVPGASTRYRIAEKYFRPRLKNEGASKDTPPIFEADTPVENEAHTPLCFEADTPPIFEATNTVQGKPFKEHLSLNTGQESPPFPLGCENPVAFALFETPPSPSPGRKRDRSRGPEKAFAEEFEKFWSAYPRRVDRGDAELAYAKAIKAGATHDELLLGAMRYAAERDRVRDPAERRKYTRHAATWLNKKSWLNEPEPVRDKPPDGLSGAGKHFQTATRGYFDD